ncbi:MAG TPA: polyribonucleotide nucleotidyltransferase, partial [Thermodesulfobacteriaceae bacterium]|nr:polyribonucleotide nucleotidyltransferase [Thermodesulfobacteriaceae bacterium]
MYRVETEINGRKFVIETGKVAKQAHGAVWVSYGDTVVLVTVVASEETRETDFVPLTVEYQEMYYAAGRIPGGYFKRELGRPSEKETITARLIDRPIRPLFPKNWRYDTQVIATVLSLDPEIDPDILAITGASAALEISHIPFAGPIAAVRVGRINGEFVLNPRASELKESELNLVVAGSEEAIVMVEGMAREVPEAVMEEALFFAHEALKPLITLQKELREKVGRPKLEIPEPQPDEALRERVWRLAEEKLEEILSTPGKVERNRKRRELYATVLSVLGEEVLGREAEV